MLFRSVSQSRYRYDLFGWYIGIGTGKRTTDIAPTNTSVDDTEGQPRSNWTGYEWIELPYAQQPEPFIAVCPVPEVVTPRQAKLALLQAGLLDEVEAGIEAIADPITKRIAKLDWNEANEFRRDWPLLNQLAAGMGITDGQLDELFRVAAGII